MKNEFDDRSVILCKNPEVFPKIQKQSEKSNSLLGEQLTLFMSGPEIRELDEEFGTEENSVYGLEGIYKMDL